MDKKKLDRISELSRKQRSEGLNEEELAEQKILREEYLQSIRNNFRSVLENIEFTDKEWGIYMLKYVVLGLVIFLCYNISPLLGTVAVTLMLAYILYVNIPTFYSIKGNKEINDGNYEKALLAFKKAVDTKRASGAIHLSYGMLLLRCGKPEDSVSVFNSIILYSKAKDNIKHQAKQYRVLAYHKLGQTEDALEEAQEIFESYKNTISYGLLCYLKLANNQPIDEVLPLCEEDRKSVV